MAAIYPNFSNNITAKRQAIPKHFHMKTKASPKRRIKHVSKGFALIATITLMMLLALLSVGLLTIASTQVRLADKHLFAAEAKSLAKFSLEVALGQLQCELGPDQRVSANSGILTSGTDNGDTPYILGVWNSWDSWLNQNNSSGQSISSTYDSGRSSMFRRWLISDPDFRGLSELTSAKGKLGLRSHGTKSNRSARLLGPGTIGTPVNSNSQDKGEIYARLVKVEDFNKKSTNKKNSAQNKYIAWWITGENQKARINLAPHASEDNADVLSVMRSTWDTPGPDLDALGVSGIMPNVDSNDLSATQKLISLDTLLASNKTASMKELGSVYHDITLSSSSLLTDSKFGGLKKDLNVLFSHNKLPEEFQNPDSDIGLRPFNTNDGNPTVMKRPIGSWNQLFLWSNIWDSSVKRGDKQDSSAAFIWEGQTPKSIIACDHCESSYFMDNKNTYMRHPILLRFYSFVGLNYVRHGNVHPNRGGWIDARIAVIPVYVWWNPYNVDLELKGVDGSYWGGYFGEHRFMPLIMSHNVKFAWNQLDENALNSYSENCLVPYNNIVYNNRQVADFGASFRTTSRLNSAGDPIKGEAPVLKAGEIVVFAQPVVGNIQNGNEVYKAKNNSRDFAPDRFPMKEGWEQSPYQVSSYAINLTDGVRYELLDGSGFNQVGTAKASVQFATELSDINVTPDEHILGIKFNDDNKSKKLGTFVMGAGLMSPKKMNQHSAPNGKNSAEIDIFSKISPAILNLNWGVRQEPLLDQVRFPAEMWEDNEGDDLEQRKRGYYGQPSLDSTFIAYYGVSAKWGKQPVIGTFPSGKDYRAKTWQHSSPLFWGNQMPNGGSDLGRAYNPYQFEVKNANSDFYPITIGNVISNDGTRLSPFGGPGAEQVNKIVAAELPYMQPASIAGFAGCRLTPGWYKTSSRGEMARRFAYQSGVPGVGIGNAFADPMIPADRVFSNNDAMTHPELSDFWDHAFMINDAMWDSWFASSIGIRPRSATGGQREELEAVAQQAFDVNPDKESKTSGIANRRFVPNLLGTSADQIIGQITNAENGYKHTSKYLTVAGGFNVNSTSLKAWEGTLLGLKKRKLAYMNNGKPTVLNSGNTVNFSRMGIASSNQSHVDDYGSIGITNGVSDGDAQAWTDLRTLSDSQISELAQNMVKEVKKRGPFLNMADFINRRLQNGEMGVKGALQAAIDESSINSTFNELSDMIINPKVGYPHPAAAQGSVHTAAPGYLIQSDVLAVLGNILTTRDDTFTIRAYGELTNKEGRVLSRAWCEAVVQRGIHYVDPIDSPETPVREVDMKTGNLKNTSLSPVNKAFGRRFNVISFRWLSPEEV